jgi:hypothetical protein
MAVQGQPGQKKKKKTGILKLPNTKQGLAEWLK